MSFKENINRICAEKNTYLSHVVKKVKGSSSFATAINNGSLPKESELVEMAKILHCSVIDFFSDEDDTTHVTKSSTLSEDEKDILRIFQSLSRREKHNFMSMAYEFENKQELEGDKGATKVV